MGNSVSNSKKNIALFISSLHGGGAERVVSRLTKVLAGDYNVYVFLIDANNQQYECDKNCTIVDLGKGGKSFRTKELKTITKINKAIKEYEIDTCISFLSGANMINSFFVKGCRKLVSVRVYIHKDALNESTHVGFDKYEVQAYRVFCRKCDKSVAITNKMAEALKEVYGLADDKVCVIENPYDIDEIKVDIEAGFSASDADLRRFFEKYKTTIAIGRLSKQKDYFSQIKAFKKVADKVDNAGLVILGEGEQKDELQRFIDELQLSERVILAGRKSNPFPYIAASELYISTSHVEGFPNGLVEAMACHVAPLHTNCLTGPEEILIDGSGILLPDLAGKTGEVLERAIEEIADVWIDILNDDKKRNDIAQKAYNRAKDYSYDNIAKKWKELIG